MPILRELPVKGISSRISSPASSWSVGRALSTRVMALASITLSPFRIPATNCGTENLLFDLLKTTVLLKRIFIHAHFPHGGFNIFGKAVFFKFWIKIGRVRRYVLWAVVRIGKEKDPGHPVFGMGHEIPIRFHVLPKGIGRVYCINPDHRPCIVLIAVFSRFGIVAL